MEIGLALIFVFIFFLGTIVGSFLNVAIYRYNTGMSVVKGRSQCFTCGHTLSWFELIPLFSFLFQGGKCRNCEAKISWQYPVVEFFTGLLFVLVAIKQYSLHSFYSVIPHGLTYWGFLLVFYFSIVCLLLVISVYDLRHKIIPNSLVYWFIGLSVFKLVSFFICSGNSPFVFPFVYDLFSPIILSAPFAFLWFISGGRWIGFGDAKLACGIGALLGFVYGLSAIILGFWVGAVVCLLWLGVQKFYPDLSMKILGIQVGSKTEIPFAPFLIIGTLVVLFTHVDVLGISGYFSL